MPSQETLYYIIVFISLIYILSRTRINKLGIFVILVFWSGMFSFMGIQIHNAYKVLIVLYAFYIWWPKIFKPYFSIDKYVNIAFITFTLSFWISYILQGGNIITMLSQYGYKYCLVFIIYHGIKDIMINKHKREYLKSLLLNILFVQVYLSVIKIVIFGFGHESHVGSITYGSGGTAVVLPIVGLIFYWITKNQMLEKRDWLIIASFFIIAIASGKRAPVFLFPVFTLLLMVSWKNIFNIRTVSIIIPLVLLIFYFGVRVTPSLNPDREIWGSFNINHVIDYTLEYNFGTNNLTSVIQGNQPTSGRGGSLLLLFNTDNLGLNNTEEILFGRGLYRVATREEGRFIGGSAYGIDHQGLIGSIVIDFYALGLLGMVLIILFSYAIINTCQYQRIKWILLAFYIWEYLLYGNLVIFNNASAILVVFIIFYGNVKYFQIRNQINNNYYKKSMKYEGTLSSQCSN